LGDQSGSINNGRKWPKALESSFFGKIHCLFRALLRGCAVSTRQVVISLKAGSRDQNVGIGRPLSHLQQLARFRPGTIWIAIREQANAQVAERGYSA
jgi:hypothetical protein